MKQYEYKVVTYETKGVFGGTVEAEHLEAKLNALGAEGWELVSGVNTTQSYGSSKSIVCVFKRAKQ